MHSISIKCRLFQNEVSNMMKGDPFDDLLAEKKKEVTGFVAVIGALIGGAFGIAIAGPFGLVIGGILGAILGELMERGIE